LAAFAAVACLAPIAASRASAAPASALLGLDSVHVRIEGVTPSVEETHLTRAGIDSLLMSHLGAGGIAAAAAPRGARAHEDGVLSLDVTYLMQSGWHIASVTLSLGRSAHLDADPATTITSTVWSRGTVVVARKKKLAAEATAAIADLAAEFVRDFRSANPR
jgi:hypothetical protein